MSITIDVLNFGSCKVPRAFLVHGGDPTEIVDGPMYGFLIRGAADKPILVDCGPRSRDALLAAGFPHVDVDESHTLDAQLARFDITPEDLGMVLLTHLHIDHAGQLDRVPMSVPVVVSRREIEVAFSSPERTFYPAQDLHHIVDRIGTPGALAMVDPDLSGPLQLLPGIRCEAAHGHTEGSLLYRVQLDDGMATICGDVVYSIQGSLVDRPHKLDAFEPAVSNNHALGLAAEVAAIRRALEGSRYLLPCHDTPAVLDFGRVVGRPDVTTTLGAPVAVAAD